MSVDDDKATTESAEDGIIKPEFIISDHRRELSIDCVSENDKRKLNETDIDTKNETQDKKLKLSKKQLAKKLKGQNKARGLTFKVEKKDSLCPRLANIQDDNDEKCTTPTCQFDHDIQKFLANKLPDIGSTCYVYNVRGHCPWGLSCRFGAEHITPEGKNKINKEKNDAWLSDKSQHPLNTIDKVVQIDLRKKNYDFTKAEDAIKTVDKAREASQNKEESTGESLGPVDDSDIIKLRPAEKKKIDWTDKLYLSPLTTVGNLPFRRICKEFGADITCGEMAMAKEILQGSNPEWALMKRHPSEDLFGVQICGNNPYIMTKSAQVIQETCEVDFIDINLGCPIDFVYEFGGGSGLLRREKVLTSIVKSMYEVMNIPLTIKSRTGISMGKNSAHFLMPMYRDAGVSLATLHGRSREQRYTKNADWEYIEECARIASPMPLFGNGDILSYNDYEARRQKAPSVSGVMIGRGALIKPWIFQEIKERRHIDMPSSERLEMLKRFANYGLEHWGSDTRGVENTRRFMLEWLSFLHRYIPVGVLVHPPQLINERPPFYKGRDDLETLMASQNCSDWIKISEMILGKVPDGFTFLPKHKANAWK